MAKTLLPELKQIFLAEGFDKGFEYYGRNKRTIQSSFKLGLGVLNTLIDFARLERANLLLNC